MPDRRSPIYALLTSRKVWIALGATAVSIAVALGVDPDKAELIIGSVVALAIVCIGSIAFEDGKALEGTVPAGRQPAAPMQINVAGTGPNVEGEGGAGATSNLTPRGTPPTAFTTSTSSQDASATWVV